MTALFETNQRNDVIRIASYHRFDFEVAVIHSPSREHHPICSSIAEPFSSTAVLQIGSEERADDVLVKLIIYR